MEHYTLHNALSALRHTERMQEPVTLSDFNLVVKDILNEWNVKANWLDRELGKMSIAVTESIPSAALGNTTEDVLSGLNWMRLNVLGEAMSDSLHERGLPRYLANRVAHAHVRAAICIAFNPQYNI